MSKHYNLVQDCSEYHLNIEECATNLCEDFEQLIMFRMGGSTNMIRISNNFSEAVIRLISHGDNLKYVLIRITDKKLSLQDERTLVKFADCVHRCMSIRLPLEEQTSFPLDFDNMFAKVDATIVKPNFNDLKSVTLYNNMKYIDLGLHYLVEESIKRGLNDTLVDCLIPSEDRLISSEGDYKHNVSIGGLKIPELFYSERVVSFIRDHVSFGMGWPDSDTSFKKNFTCINPSHKDNNPSMSITFRPFFWRSSKKVCDGMSVECIQALESALKKETTCSLFVKLADNVVKLKNGMNVITYVCSAKCFSCTMYSLLSNEKMEQLI
uniref:Uncharacterized protein n=1 Tax=Chionoecetes opilio bacilliform virus TaxID=1825681 RepID=A0A1Q3DL21_9VIRU|nr:wsv137-like protein [Chionoecetes opilio bacilliform virus]GAV93174.1 hypothetical protein SCV_050 [Chionoecetes opilio bacilliform virus]